MPFIDPGMILAFILNHRDKQHQSRIQKIHKSNSYNPFVKAVRGALDILPFLKNHLTLEIGSEGGSASYGLGNCIRTDLTPLPDLDVICDATCLPFRDHVFGRTWGVYLAHHVCNIRALISEGTRVADKLFLFDFQPNTWMHYYSKIWDWLIFNTSIKAVNSQVLTEIDPNHRAYKRSHLGTILFVFEPNQKQLSVQE